MIKQPVPGAAVGGVAAATTAGSTLAQPALQPGERRRARIGERLQRRQRLAGDPEARQSGELGRIGRAGGETLLERRG